MNKRVGLLVLDEVDLAEEIARRCAAHAGIEAELVVVGGTAERQPVRYDVIVDRASALVPHYRAYLRAAALAGATIVNDPFVPADRFFQLALASHIGLSTPRAVLLPQHGYGPAIDQARMLRNLEFPLRWQEIAAYVELPALLRSIDRQEPFDAKVATLEELWRAFDATGERVVMLQQELALERRVRCLCFGRERAIVQGGDEPGAARAGLALARALGWDLCAVELGVAGGVLYVLEVDPLPSLEPSEPVLGALTDAIVAAAWGPPAATRARHELP